MSEDIYSLKIFNWIKKDIVEQVINNSPEKAFKSGEIILLEWTSSNWEWYIIKSGKVKVSIAWKQIAELSAW